MSDANNTIVPDAHSRFWSEGVTKERVITGIAVVVAAVSAIALLGAILVTVNPAGMNAFIGIPTSHGFTVGVYITMGVSTLTLGSSVVYITVRLYCFPHKPRGEPRKPDQQREVNLLDSPRVERRGDGSGTSYSVNKKPQFSDKKRGDRFPKRVPGSNPKTTSLNSCPSEEQLFGGPAPLNLLVPLQPSKAPPSEWTNQNLSKLPLPQPQSPFAFNNPFYPNGVDNCEPQDTSLFALSSPNLSPIPLNKTTTLLQGGKTPPFARQPQIELDVVIDEENADPCPDMPRRDHPSSGSEEEREEDPGITLLSSDVNDKEKWGLSNYSDSDSDEGNNLIFRSQITTSKTTPLNPVQDLVNVKTSPEHKPVNQATQGVIDAINAKKTGEELLQLAQKEGVDLNNQTKERAATTGRFRSVFEIADPDQQVALAIAKQDHTLLITALRNADRRLEQGAAKKIPDLLKKHATPLLQLTYGLMRGDYHLITEAINAGADINARYNGIPILMLAVEAGDCRAINMMFDKGVDINTTLSGYQRPLSTATGYTNQQGFDPKSGQLETLIEVAIREGYNHLLLEVLKRMNLIQLQQVRYPLPEFGEESVLPILSIAAYYGNCEAVKLLLEHEQKTIELSKRKLEGIQKKLTPLVLSQDYATPKDTSSTEYLSLKRLYDQETLLLQSLVENSFLNRSQSCAISILEMAILRDDSGEIFKVLVEAGADEKVKVTLYDDQLVSLPMVAITYQNAGVLKWYVTQRNAFLHTDNHWDRLCELAQETDEELLKILKEPTTVLD